jgi:hypothetical protein
MAWITVLMYGITIIVRFFGLVGLMGLIHHKQYKTLLLTIPPVLMLALLFIFDGHGRVRLPVEPLLMIWTVYGVAFFKSLLVKHPHQKMACAT